MFYFKASQNNNTIYFFNMPPFSGNYSFDSETLNCCTQLLLQYFGPSINQRHFQILHSCVWWATGFSFQNEPNTEVEIKLWKRPQPLLQTVVNFPCTKLGFCWRYESGHRPVGWWNLHFWNALSYHKQSRGQNIIDVHICVDFGTLFHKNQKRFPSFWHCNPNHDRCWLLSAKNG